METRDAPAVTGLSHLTLSVRDLDRSFEFYAGVLGVRPRLRWARGAYLEAGSLWLALLCDERARPGPLPEYSHAAFSVAPAGFDALAARVRASGAVIFQPNTSEGDSLYFLDPDGHKLEIHAGELASRLASVRAAPYEGAVFFDDEPG